MRGTLDEGDNDGFAECLFKPAVYLEDDMASGTGSFGGTAFLLSAAIHIAIMCQEVFLDVKIGGMNGVLVAAHAGALGVSNRCRLILLARRRSCNC